jgi:Uma2 family endonuclease
MVMPAKHSRRWTRADVLALMEASPLATPRYEVVRGELLVTPSPGGLHQFAVFGLAKALSAYCELTGVGETLISPSDVDLEGDGLVQPDVYVVSRAEGLRLRREGPATALLLAAEVLSPGSEHGDRGPKRELYHATVPAYWLVDVRHRQVEQWIAGRDGSTVEHERLVWHPAGADRPFVLSLREYFAKVRAD